MSERPFNRSLRRRGKALGNWLLKHCSFVSASVGIVTRESVEIRLRSEYELFSRVGVRCAKESDTSDEDVDVVETRMR